MLFYGKLGELVRQLDFDPRRMFDPEITVQNQLWYATRNLACTKPDTQPTAFFLPVVATGVDQGLSEFNLYVGKLIAEPYRIFRCETSSAIGRSSTEIVELVSTISTSIGNLGSRQIFRSFSRC